MEEPDLLVAVYSGDTFQAKVGVFESVQIRVEPLGDDKYELWGQVDGSDVGWVPLKDLGSMGSAEELSQLGDDETTPTEPEPISPNPTPPPQFRLRQNSFTLRSERLPGNWNARESAVRVSLKASQQVVTRFIISKSVSAFLNGYRVGGVIQSVEARKLPCFPGTHVSTGNNLPVIQLVVGYIELFLERTRSVNRVG